MKGTIFERGSKIRNKFNRTMAWVRVKKHWLFMPRKEYKRNVFYLILGMITWFLGIYIGLMWIFEKVVTFITRLQFEKKMEKYKKTEED